MSIVGMTVKTSFGFVEDIIVINYELQYYWGGDKISPIYGMATEFSHKLFLDLSIPIFGYDYEKLQQSVSY